MCMKARAYPPTRLRSREVGVHLAESLEGVPIVAQRVRNSLGSMRIQVRFPALLSRLKIWYYRELRHRLQMWLGSDVAVAVV